MTRLASLMLSLTATLSAQSILQTRTGGVLGDSVTYEITGPAGLAYAWIPAVNAGPTPLAIVDRRDPRSLSVGLEFASLLIVGQLTQQPTVLRIPLPLYFDLHGFDLHAQVLSYPGQTYLLGELSNPVVTTLVLPRQWLARTDLLGIARIGSGIGGVTPLPDGSLLLSGGYGGTNVTPTVFDSTEILDPNTQSSRPGPAMAVPRAMHTSTALADGRVLIAGGSTGRAPSTSSCEIYDPATGLLTPTGDLDTGRVGHSATLLADGKVLVVGGAKESGSFLEMLDSIKQTSEIYDAAAGTWRKAQEMPDWRAAHRVAVCPNGDVLVTGGTTGRGLSATTTNTTLIYRTVFSAGPPMPVDVAFHDMVCLSRGKILVTGGVSAGGASVALARSTRFAFLFDNGGWRRLPDMADDRVFHSTVELSDGRVLVIGGFRGSLLSQTPLSSTEIFDPVTESWSPGPTLPHGVGAGIVLALGADRFVVAGGWQGSGEPSRDGLIGGQ